MDNEQREDQYLENRSVVVSAWGADLNALEMNALDIAREFFGPEIRLEISQDYKAHSYTDEPKGRFHAQVTVVEVTQ